MSHSDFLFPRDISCPLTELLFCRTAGPWQRTDLNKHRLSLCCVQSCLCFYSIKGHGPSGSAIIYKQICLVKPTLSFFIYFSKWCGIYHGMREILRIPGVSVSHPLVSLLLIWFQVVIVLHSLQLCIHRSICVDHRAARRFSTEFAWILFQNSTSATYTRFKRCAMLRQT